MPVGESRRTRSTSLSTTNAPYQRCSGAAATDGWAAIEVKATSPGAVSLRGRVEFLWRSVR